jgi:hypothetical protein
METATAEVGASFGKGRKDVKDPKDPKDLKDDKDRKDGREGVEGSCGASGGGGGDGGFEGLGFGETLFPGLAPAFVEVLGDFEVEGLADAVWGVLHEGAEHGLGSREETELALVVRAEVFRAEVEDARAVDRAGVGGGFAASQAEVDEVHEGGLSD